jgi:DNA modification methylase
MEKYVITLLIAVIVLQQIWHGIERKDLYNRIMAKDLSEYRARKPQTIKNIIKRNIEKNLKDR